MFQRNLGLRKSWRELKRAAVLPGMTERINGALNDVSLSGTRPQNESNYIFTNTDYDDVVVLTRRGPIPGQLVNIVFNLSECFLRPE